jgi:hypothetical protein
VYLSILYRADLTGVTTDSSEVIIGCCIFGPASSYIILWHERWYCDVSKVKLVISLNIPSSSGEAESCFLLLDYARLSPHALGQLTLLNCLIGQNLQNITHLTPCYRPVESAVVAGIQWRINELIRPCRSNKIVEGGRGVRKESTVGGESGQKA